MEALQKPQAELLSRCEDVAATLKSLAHGGRLKILCFLLDGPKTVNEITEFTGLSQSGVSQYLIRMKKEGLLESEREGHFVRYRIEDERIFRLIGSLSEIFCN